MQFTVLQKSAKDYVYTEPLPNGSGPKIGVLLQTILKLVQNESKTAPVVFAGRVLAL